MSKPTILVDGHVLDGKPQGSSAYIAGLYRAVAYSGAVNVRMATHDVESLRRWDLELPGIDWVPLTSTNRYHRLAVEMTGLQTRTGADFSHFQYITPLVKRSRWILSLHDLLFLDLPQHFPLGYRLKNHALFRASALRSDIVLTISEYSRDAIRRHFHVPDARIHLTVCAPDGFVNADDEAVPGLAPGRFVVYVSRFEPRKNQHALVQAFLALQGQIDEDIRLVLVGYSALSYPDLDAALAQGQADGKDCVRVLSDLSHAQLTWLYRHTAGSIYPSHAEGFGMPVLEAVAAGGLSYCADNTAMSDLVPYVHGSFDAADDASIRATLLRVIKGQDTAKRDSVRAQALKHFNWTASAEAFLEAIGA